MALPSARLPDLPVEALRAWAYAELFDWVKVARPKQLIPLDQRRTFVMGGRGSGKTRTGAETLAHWAWSNPNSEWCVVAPTDGHARSVCIEGHRSGLLKALGGVGGPKIAKWNVSKSELHLNNGSTIYVDGADDGAPGIQGRNLQGGWCDEAGLWSLLQWRRTWQESIGFALREGQTRMVVTGTPKQGHPLVKLLIKDPGWVKVCMPTRENIDNLSEEAINEMEREWAGTRMGRQELEGEFLEDVVGALWRQAQIDDLRVATHPDLSRIVVAIDPAITANEKSDETGIMVAGKGVDGEGYLLADRSCKESPEGWGRRAVHAYDEFHADRIVAEQNQGGEMITHVIKSIDERVPVTLVHASRGKVPRAEPISSLGEQGRIHHVGEFRKLEEQLTTWTQDAGTSPDRLDAYVWAFTELMLGNKLWAL